MIVNNDKITFTSNIKLITPSKFKQLTSKLSKKKHEVGYPWTPETLKTGKKIYTTSIMDCIAGVIINGRKSKMFHLCTRNQADAKRTRQKGFNIKDAEHRLLQNINLKKEKIHAFILGGFQFKENSKYNVNKLNKIIKIFKKNNIPYTVIGARKDVHFFGKYSLYYEAKNDTIYITNNLIHSKGLDGRSIEVEIKENNKIAYNIYSKNESQAGPMYITQRKETNLEDYFKSQFRKVQVSKFDNFA